jgi:predicted transcriptional regulator
MYERALHIRVREEQYTHLQRIAESQDASVGWTVRQAIDLYLLTRTGEWTAEPKDAA